MKTKVWVNGNKMLMESGHKTFDMETNVISTGNVIANTQYSSYIRPFTETETGVKGHTREPGYLRAFDLRIFTEHFRLPNYLRKKIEHLTREEGGILYVFYHHNGNTRITHGWVLTSRDHKRMQEWVTGPTWKSYHVIDECVKYITNEDNTEEVQNA